MGIEKESKDEPVFGYFHQGILHFIAVLFGVDVPASIR